MLDSSLACLILFCLRSVRDIVFIHFTSDFHKSFCSRCFCKHHRGFCFLNQNLTVSFFTFTWQVLFTYICSDYWQRWSLFLSSNFLSLLFFSVLFSLSLGVEYLLVLVLLYCLYLIWKLAPFFSFSGYFWNFTHIFNNII